MHKHLRHTHLNLRSSLRSSIILLLVLVISATPVAATELSNQQQRELQEQALHILGGNANVISRWHGAIRPQVVGAVSSRTIDVVARTFGDISRITGIAFESESINGQTLDEYRRTITTDRQSRCAHEQCANFDVIVASVEQMRELATLIPLRPLYLQSLQPPSSPLCFFAPLQNPRMQIVRSLVFIRHDLSADMQDTCIREELYQSFGMFGDVTDSTFFSFDNRETPKSITYYDQQLLRAIYHPTLRAGAPVFQVIRLFMREFGALR